MTAATEHASIRDQSVRVRADDGVEADLRMIAPSNADVPLLYWLPALGVPARSYVAFAHALASRGIAVALHEWRGVGSSDRRAGRRTDWGYRALLQRDLPAGFRAARDALGARDLLLGGHSLGGQLALLSAALQPHPPRRIVLVASGAPWWRAFRHRHLVRTVVHAAPLIARAFGKTAPEALFGQAEAIERSRVEDTDAGIPCRGERRLRDRFGDRRVEIAERPAAEPEQRKVERARAGAKLPRSFPNKRS